MVRISLEEAKTRASTIDRKKLDAVTQEDIERVKAEDGCAGVDPPISTHPVVSPRQLRVGLA